jgi:ketosteroid isomerase-like protein
MISKSATILALGAFALAGCNHKAEATADSAAIEKQIRDLETQWGKDYDSKDVEALAGHYTDDAALANPGSTLATDSEARRQGISKFVADPAMKIQFSSDRIEVASSADLASSRGHYTMTFTDPESKEPVEGNGSYLTVYRKQSDGSWKAVEDFVTPGPSPAAAK